MEDKIADEDEISALMTSYVAAVGRDTREAATHYEVPAVLMTPGKFLVFNDRSEISDFLESLLAPFRSRGYAYSEFLDVSIRKLSADMALCSAITVRRLRDGSELQRSAATYVVARDAGSWKIRQLLADRPRLPGMSENGDPSREEQESPGSQSDKDTPTPVSSGTKGSIA